MSVVTVVVFAEVVTPVKTPPFRSAKSASLVELSRQVSVIDVLVPVTESNVGAVGGVVTHCNAIMFDAVLPVALFATIPKTWPLFVKQP